MSEPNESSIDRGKGFLHQLGNVVAVGANVHSVFGEAIERGDTTIVPVARVRYGLGGGERLGSPASSDGFHGAGAGAGVYVTPAGFIQLRNGGAEFHAIADPRAEAFRNFALLSGLGLSVLFLLRGVASLYRR